MSPQCAKQLAAISVNILMQVLHAARYTRCDLTRCVNMMACYVTKWTAVQDVELDSMMGYIQETARWNTFGWFGDLIEHLSPHLFADADLAGCPDTARSASCLLVAFRGPHPIRISNRFWLQATGACATCAAESELRDQHELRAASLWAA